MSRKPMVTPKTARGDKVPAGIHRVKFAQEQLSYGGFTTTRDRLMARFGISDRQAATDIKEAYRLIANDAEAERPNLRARELERCTRIAAAAELRGKFQAALMASARIAKLNGLDIDVMQVVPSSPEQQATIAALNMTPQQRRERREFLERELEQQKVARKKSKPEPEPDGPGD